MLLLDLYCGLGGWSLGFAFSGWKCIGVDLQDFSAGYPGKFIQANVLTWDGWEHLKPDLIVASPPCEQFSRHDMPWTRKRNPAPPDLALWHRALFIATELDVPFIIENVRGAQRYFGRSKLNCGPFHLWGDVPALLPCFSGRNKEELSGHERALRAKIPFELSSWMARVFTPEKPCKNRNYSKRGSVRLSSQSTFDGGTKRKVSK